MNTNELIANAVAKKTTFGVSNTESKNTQSSDSVNYADANLTDGKKTFASNLLSKFYTFDSGKVVDTAVKGEMGNLDNKKGETKSALTDAPTAADFAALNAFAKSAIKDVSQQRSDLGAIQNRLEHTISNLDNIVENTTSAESQIRDTDIATEMVRYANNNILQQAGTSMLSQANQSNQLALSLLG
jgi:flagellin-like hook-associated protein FlgL